MGHSILPDSLVSKLVRPDYKGTIFMHNALFDIAMLDLTNFLAYMTDPMKIERETIGTYTLLYLFIFTMLSYLLYREFKKDLH